MHAAGVLPCVFRIFQDFEFLVMVYLEQCLERKDDGNDSQDADRICHGIGRCKFLRGHACRHGGGAPGCGNVDESLLGGTEAGGIGDGAGHDAHHCRELLPGEGRYSPCDDHRKKDVHHGQEVHLDPAAAEGVEETGADLKAYREHEKDKAELLHEMEDVKVGLEPKMPHQDARKEDPGGAQRDAFHFEPAKIEADSYHKRKQKDCVGYPLPKEQIMHQNTAFTRKQVLSPTLPSTYHALPSL